MIKVLFLIHDLGQGGAEKVLVNLVNNMDSEKFDITVMALFGGGVNEQFLKKSIRYHTVFPRSIPANSHLMKLFTPEQLHRMFVKEHYDIEVSYLEGPSARVISGCRDEDTKLVCWIHGEQKTKEKAAAAFRNYQEALKCYSQFNQIISVSETVKKDFLSIMPVSVPISVLYNTNESERIMEQAQEDRESALFDEKGIKLVGVGKLVKTKGFDRLLRIIKQLRAEQYPVHLYLLGSGPEEENLKRFLAENQMNDVISFLGYQTNPYKYVANCDLFVCSSYSEGFSTAATEALIVGTPVCTTEVSGMKEMLGENNEYGIVTENNEEALYQGIKNLLDDPALLDHYREQAVIRGQSFSTEATVEAVEEMLLSL